MLTSADKVSLARSAVAQLVWLPSEHPYGALADIAYVLAVAADALDGYIARASGVASLHGDFIDVAADRLTEQAAWISLARNRRAPLLATVMLWRLAATDAARSMGRYGAAPPPRKGDYIWRHRVSKAGYNALKVATIVAYRRSFRSAPILAAALVPYSIVRGYYAVSAALDSRRLGLPEDGLRSYYRLQLAVSTASALTGSAVRSRRIKRC